ncbi:MAG TPA: hypothetical protein DCL63_06575 [Firmicutes bacterium]|nr:hypothetical protein [Bacillota bacterium]
MQLFNCNCQIGEGRHQALEERGLVSSQFQFIVVRVRIGIIIGIIIGLHVDCLDWNDRDETEHENYSECEICRQLLGQYAQPPVSTVLTA